MDAIIDMGHPLVKLAQAIDWTFLKREFGAVYTDCPGQPPLPTRLMAGLAMVPGLRQANFNEALIRIKASGRALYTKLLVRDETTQIPTRHRVGGRMTQVERVAGFQKATATTPAKTTGQGILRVAALIVLAGFVTAALIFWLLSQKETADRLLVLYGNIDIREIAVAFNNNGPVTRMLVQEGDRVRRGELIAEMDDRRYVAALEQAEGQMRNQEQVLARLVAGSRPEEIAQAKATMDALSVTYQNDEVIYRRAETLLSPSYS